MTCLFVYGSAGTGKTLILMEALKIKLSKLRSQGKRTRILATTFYDEDPELHRNFREKYLVNLKNIEVIGLQKLCLELKIEHYDNTPRDTINRVITSLSDIYPDTLTVLLVDEVRSCASKQTTPDWRDLEVRENVIWLLGLSPRAYKATTTEVLPPVKCSVLSKQ